jgi:hypothetical protein
LECQYRLAPVPVPGEVAVDGSPPDGVGVVWLPRTAVGRGNGRVEEGVAEAATLLDGVADVDGDTDCVAEAEGGVVTEDGEDGVVADVAVADGDVACVAVGETPVELASGLELA